MICLFFALIILAAASESFFSSPWIHGYSTNATTTTISGPLLLHLVLSKSFLDFFVRFKLCVCNSMMTCLYDLLTSPHKYLCIFWSRLLCIQSSHFRFGRILGAHASSTTTARRNYNGSD